MRASRHEQAGLIPRANIRRRAVFRGPLISPREKSTRRARSRRSRAPLSGPAGFPSTNFTTRGRINRGEPAGINFRPCPLPSERLLISSPAREDEACNKNAGRDWARPPRRLLLCAWFWKFEILPGVARDI